MLWFQRPRVGFIFLALYGGFTALFAGLAVRLPIMILGSVLGYPDQDVWLWIILGSALAWPAFVVMMTESVPPADVLSDEDYQAALAKSKAKAWSNFLAKYRD